MERIESSCSSGSVSGQSAMAFASESPGVSGSSSDAPSFEIPPLRQSRLPTLVQTTLDRDPSRRQSVSSYGGVAGRKSGVSLGGARPSSAPLVRKPDHTPAVPLGGRRHGEEPSRKKSKTSSRPEVVEPVRRGMGKGLMTAPPKEALRKKKTDKVSGKKKANKEEEKRSAPKDLAAVFGESRCSSKDLDFVLSRGGSEAGLEIRIPGKGERPWTAPEGSIAVYTAWFEEGLWFPLPELLIAYCEARHVALSQLSPAVIRYMISAMVMAAECGFVMTLDSFEAITSFTPIVKTPGTFYANAKTGLQYVDNHPSKTELWKEKYLYVKVNEASVPDPSREYMRGWSPFYGTSSD